MLDDLINPPLDEVGEGTLIELPDGTAEVTFGSLDEPEPEHAPEADFNANLAETLDDIELSRVSEELLEGIESDDESRQDWLDQRRYGIDLLGLDPRRKSGASGDDGNATVDHPLLLEAVLRFQANARGEMLPVDGPAKVRNDTLQMPMPSAPQPPAPPPMPMPPPGAGPMPPQPGMMGAPNGPVPSMAGGLPLGAPAGPAVRPTGIGPSGPGPAGTVGGSSSVPGGMPFGGLGGGFGGAGGPLPGLGHNGGPPLPPISTDALADALESEINHYLTTVATEFYPDTDQMHLMLGFGGTTFKKIYHCPLRGRPVSESVDAADLIVSNDAVSLETAARVTQVIRMRDATLRRMQLLGAYRDVELGEPEDDEANSVEAKVAEVQGRDETAVRTEDRERTIYECYCELDLLGHEHTDNSGAPTGLALPYKVTIDKASRQVLEIRRNWDEPARQHDGSPAPHEPPLPVAKQTFVTYTFVPGFGFYGLGLLHILGNTTRAATSALRIMLDAGMRANFPGGFIDKSANRNNNTRVTGKPGEFIPIETGGRAIDTIVSPFPFKGPDPTTLELLQAVVQTAERVGGTAESNVSEGRADAPVGTTLALLEQQKVILDAVHKRMHTAQGTELKLLCERLKEDPEALFRYNPRPALPWTRELVLQALDDNDLVPVADPNASTQMARMAKLQAVQQLAAGLGPLTMAFFDIGEMIKMTLEEIKLPNYQRILNPNPPPSAALMQLMSQAGGKGHGAQQDPSVGQARMMDAQTGQFEAQTGAQLDQARLALDAKNSDLEHRRQIAALQLQHQREMAKLRLAAHDNAMSHQREVSVSPDPALQARLDVMDAQTRAQDAATREKALVAKVHDNVIDAQQQAADRQSENSIAALNTLKELAIHKGEMADNEAAREAQIEAARLSAKSKGGGGE